MQCAWVAIALFASAVAYLLLRRRGLAESERAPATEPHPTEPSASGARRRKKRALATGATDVRGALPAVVGDLLDDSSVTPKARGKHYAFAHGLLRQAQRDHGKWLRLSAAAQAGSLDGLLASLWRDMPDEQAEPYSGPPTARALDDGVLVRMPDVIAPGESMYVAIVERDGLLRYFTLDRSGRGFAVREWTEETHVEHGPCEGEQEAFLTEIARVLARLEA